MLRRGSAKGSLVQRELSAKLTEGLPDSGIDAFANSMKIAADFIIGNSNNSQTITFQKSRTLFIFFYVPVFIMLRAIQFDYQLGFRTVKICYIFAQYFLSSKSDRISPQKIVP